MAVLTTRAEFIDFCLRKLGAPQITIDLDPTNLDDRVDEALKLYWDFHFDGSERVY